jgi:hypothetical protein
MKKGAPEGAPKIETRKQNGLYLAKALGQFQAQTPPPGGLFGIDVDSSGKLFGRYRSIDWRPGDNLTHH